MRYRRILLKISGEALMGRRNYGVDPEVTAFIARQVSEVAASGVQVAIVVGGGNIFRGLAAAATGMDRATADYIGMLATVMNGLALQDALEKAGQPTRVLSAIDMTKSPSRTSAAAPCVTWRRAGSSSLPPAPATRTSRPIPRPRCVPSRSAPRSCSRRPRSTAFTTAIR